VVPPTTWPIRQPEFSSRVDDHRVSTREIAAALEARDADESFSLDEAVKLKRQGYALESYVSSLEPTSNI
jgi:hypothetical protein